MPEFTIHIDLNNIPTDTAKAQEALDVVNGKANIQQSTPSRVSASSKMDALKTAKAIGAVHIGKQLINTSISVAKYRVGTISARYGDTARQNEINNIISVGEREMGILGSTMSGAMAGSLVGPVGTAVGAVLGFTSSMINEAVQMFERRDQWQLQQNKNNFVENRSMERLGMMTTDRNR